MIFLKSRLKHITFSKSDSKRQISYDIAYLRNLKQMMQVNLFTKQNRFTDLENKLMATRGEGSGDGIVREFGIDMYTLLYLKWITNEDLLLYSTGNSAQYYVTT